MATLLHLKLGGVRSFGSDDQDVQFISFDKPFTLILGRNGCGKTTVIEALKYACTGALPPGQGHNFVRDPKLDRRVETRGQVMLKFSSCQGKTTVITRLMQATQKVKTIQFKSLDQTVLVTNRNGEKSTVSGRCADIDELMTAHLGVSKPILNHVIFCHQEDSYWPLDEGKKLKERFDEIFDSTRYNTCMEAVRKKRNLTLTNIKLEQAKIPFLEQNVSEVRSKRGELELLKKSSDTIKDEITELKRKISCCKEQYDLWDQRYMDYKKIEQELSDTKNQLNSSILEKKTLQSFIEVEFTGTKDELRKAIKEFDTQLGAKEQAYEQVKKTIHEVNQLESVKQKKMSEIQNSIGKLESDQKHEQKTEEDRNLRLSSLAEAFGLPPLPQGATAAEVADLTNSVKKQISCLASSITALKIAQDKEQNDLLHEIHEHRDVKSKLEAGISMKREAIMTNDSEVTDLKEKLKSVNLHLARKQRIDEDLEKCRVSYERAVKAEDPQALSNEVENFRLDCEKLEERLRELQIEVLELYKYQEAQKDLKTSEKKMNDLQTTIRRIRSKNEDFISRHLKDSVDSGIKYDLENLIIKSKKEIEQLKNQLSEKHRQASSLEQSRSYKKSLLERKEKELSKSKNSLFDECGRKNLDDVLKKIEADIETVQSDRGVFNSSSLVFNRYIKELRKPDPCCPLCSRGFGSEQEPEDLIQDLNRKVSSLPNRIEELTLKLSMLQEKQKKLLQLKPVKHLITELEETEIPALKNEISEIEENLETVNQEITLLEAGLHGPQNDLTNAEDIQNDIFDIDRCQKESKLLSNQIEKLKQEQPSSVMSRTSEQAVAEQELLQEELSSKRRQKTELEIRQRDYEKRVNELNKQVNDLVAQQLKIKELVQQEENVKERLTELEMLKDVLKSEEQELKQSLGPAQDKLRKAEKALESAKEQHKHLLQVKEKEKGERDKEIGLVAQLQKNLNNFKCQKISENLQELEVQTKSLLKEIQNCKEKRDHLDEERKDLSNVIEGHVRRKTELEQNFKLMEVVEKIEKQEIELQRVETKLGTCNFKDVSRQRDKVLNEISELRTEVSKKQGNLDSTKSNIESRKLELQKSHLQTAERKYREALVDITIKQHVEKDLQKYYTALDHAMRKFHEDRMNSVNKIIRELWRLIYKGNDIDYIEIKTDESSSNTSSSTDKKKVYNYRVVQVKNGTEIEMRNRCSAGQKVLACLIIRMALSETFSVNCGILTLDEPTTNLDKHNISSLCQAITELVNDREGSKNFQLIVITHDVEFLNAMSSVDVFPHYWEVSRNHQSKSIIKKKDVIRD